MAFEFTSSPSISLVPNFTYRKEADILHFRICSSSPHRHVLICSRVGEATALSPSLQTATLTGEEGIETRMKIDSLINLTRSGMTDETLVENSAFGVIGSGLDWQGL